MEGDGAQVGEKRPAGEAPIAGGQGEEAKRQNVGGDEGAPPSPPEEGAASEAEWVQHISKKSGKPFWYNKKTGESKWTDPAAPAPANAPRSPGSKPQSYDPAMAGGSGIGASMPPSGTVLPSNGIHPQRPGAERCQFYLQTGQCKYGESCRYDHPIDREAAVAEQGGQINRPVRDTSRPSVPDYGDPYSVPPMRPGQPDCSFFMKTGTCKFGEQCKYNHPPHMRAAPKGAAPGFGAPMPPHHAPAPSAGFWETHMSPDGIPYFFNPVTAVSTWDPPADLFAPQQNFAPPPASAAFAGAMTNYAQQGADAGRQVAAQTAAAGALSFSFDPQRQMQTAMANAIVAQQGLLPLRPGEPECAFYLKTGTCKYGHECRFHHPIGGAATQVSVQYPERPGQPDCSFFMRTGACKFGEKCKFNHPPSVGLKM